MKTSRQHKLRFIADFGTFALRQAVIRAFDRHGADWLTEEQLTQIVSQKIRNHRFAQKLNRENRARRVA